MKYFLLTIAILLSATSLSAQTNLDSLLRELDATISRRPQYAQEKEARINELVQEKVRLRSLEDLYRINNQIVSQYESFICDMAESYINENIEIAREMGNHEYLTESYLRLAFVYSLSGLFVQAKEIFDSVDYDALPEYQKMAYCWNSIRYYENLLKYTDDEKFTDGYVREVKKYRDMILEMLPDGNDMYDKEWAFKLQSEGIYDEPVRILSGIYEKQEPWTHNYAMAAGSLAKLYRLSGDRELENLYLTRAAITDTRLAVKENEALLILAMNLFEEGDIKRSYDYISAALSDANFYNSRFRNTVIARVQPVIESNYLLKIDKQRRNLRLYATLISIFFVALVIMSVVNIRQIKIVTKARRHLRGMNDKLIALNKKLDESNLIKEKYIGYFMNQCAVYINKLDEYRKDVNHKIKNGQIDRLYKPSSKELEKEVEELFENFDHAFLKLYPNYVYEFNSLLRPEERYDVEKDHLNTELRIFALMRLGITDPNQLSVFLRCSVQTIYNYRSKVKGKAINKGEQFEAEVRKLSPVTLNEESI